MKKAVLVLNADEFCRARLCRRIRFMQLIGVEVGAPDLADLSLLHELVQCAECVGYGNGDHLACGAGRGRCSRCPVVRRLSSAACFTYSGFAPLRFSSIAIPNFVAILTSVATPAERAAEEFFALGRAVRVGGVEEIDRPRRCGLDYLCGGSFVEATAEVVAADAYY